MALNLTFPLTYLITSGSTTETTIPGTSEFTALTKQVEHATLAGVALIQLREKRLTARTLYDLTLKCVEITEGTTTRLLVNDRADVARAAGADGVHLTTRSIAPHAIREAFGSDFIIGVSTHSLAEADIARNEYADFATFGPIFETPSKKQYGPPPGLESLSEAAAALKPFPLIALGGVTIHNAVHCIDAGARGIAGISLFLDAKQMVSTVELLRDYGRGSGT
jgi:thiamine-phosphate pyrophosphorylase